MNQELPDYFGFFGLPITLSLDQALLRQAFLENSRKFHPDFHTLATEEAQQHALEMSSLNNEAYKTLSDPDKRLQYVLKYYGFLQEGMETPLPPEFLMQMMDINEKVMELEFEAAPGLYEEASQEIAAFEQELEHKASAVLQTWTARDGHLDDLKIAQEYFLKKRYLLRVKENLSKFAPAFAKS